MNERENDPDVLTLTLVPLLPETPETTIFRREINLLLVMMMVFFSFSFFYLINNYLQYDRLKTKFVSNLSCMG